MDVPKTDGAETYIPDTEIPEKDASQTNIPETQESRDGSQRRKVCVFKHCGRLEWVLLSDKL